MILAAAIRGRDGAIWTLPPPARHHDIGAFMIEHGEPVPFPGGRDQGFIASYKNLPCFVGRLVALTIAEREGQLARPVNIDHLYLYTEDLW